MHDYICFMASERKLTPQQALEKLRHYCAYQERAHSEVKEKLAGYGIYYEDAEEIISSLIQDNYLNEERFARQFAGGKFRMKQWGKRKIIYHLKQKGVSEYCIKKAFQEIDGEEYYTTLENLAEKKWKSLPGKNKRLKEKKTFEFLAGRGFETDLILEVLKQVGK